jgi:hypothetical protein
MNDNIPTLPVCTDDEILAIGFEIETQVELLLEEFLPELGMDRAITVREEASLRVQHQLKQARGDR